MAISAGTRLGPYEIVGRLGSGGMGDVYRARDIRLGREVAIKTLPLGLASDPGRRGRFEQEARAAAALNHPNILGLYDIGNEEGSVYLVTELVAGETLAALIDRGRAPTRKLLDIAVQIADGMAAAHSARIVHRDLKPANVMVNAEGRVKILDFGLAKLAPTSATLSEETATVAQTQPGVILGTASYMSPEQARGSPADYRSDQFSFGLILYEMVTGKKAFEKPTAVQTMSAILSEEPPPIERDIPEPLHWVIGRCLSKDPAERYESSRDLFQELRNIRDHLTQTSTGLSAVQAPPAPREKPRDAPRRLWPIATGFGLGALVTLAAMLLMSATTPPDQSAYRFTPFSFEPGGQSSPRWSPDGKAVAYAVQTPSGVSQTFVRYLDSPVPVQVTRTAESSDPAGWTPDGKHILLTIARKPDGIWSVATVGGEPELYMKIEFAMDTGDLSPDAKSLVAFRRGDDGRYGLWISSPPGSPLQKYTPEPFASRDIYNGPQLKFSPDGKHLLLIANLESHREEAWLMPYPPNPSQPPRQVLPNLQSFGGTPPFSWMPDNRHIVLSLAPSRDVSNQLWMADTATGERYAITSGNNSPRSPSVSPDGKKIIFSDVTGSYDIVSVDLKDASAHRLIATERDELMPAWAAKQPVLAFVTDRNGPQEIWSHREGTPDRPLVTARDFPPDTTQWFMGPALSPEADRVVYGRIETRGGGDHLWISAVAGGSPVSLTNDATYAEMSGSWSPDGNWFAFLAYKGGIFYLMKAKTTGQANPAVVKKDPSGYAGVPAWSPGGDWIVYGDRLYSPDGKIEKPIGKHHARGYVFSPDGKLLYGMRADGERELLFTVDVATGAEKIVGDVGKDFRPGSNLNPAMRFSLSPDGKSIVYGSGTFRTNLWMLEGFAAKTGLLARLGLR